jgi:homoserine O-succinyltransferase
MPITLPETLPAYDVLSREGVMVMSDTRAARQDIRPLRIGLLNLMPKKIQTENQFARLIGATPLQIDFHLIRMTEHQTKNTAAEHMAAFYRPFQEVKGETFDGLIITGAPIEHLAFEEVTYWDELTEVMDWTQTHVHSTFGVCWGGMAMAYHFHGIPKHMLRAKAFGCFRHQNLAPASPYLRGFSDDFVIPVSRWTEMRAAEIEAAGPQDPSGLRRGRTLPRRGCGPPRALHLQPFRIRQRHAQGGVRPGRGERHVDQRAPELLPRGRPRAHAPQPLAQPRPSPLWQLDQRDLPVDPL